MKTPLAVLLAMLVAGCGGSESAPPATAASTSAESAASTANPSESSPPATREGSATATNESAPASAPASNDGATPSDGTPGGRAPDANTASTPKAAPKQIGARHVLVQWMGADRAGPNVLRTREQALVIATDVQRRAKAGEDLGRLAVEYSDEPNAAARGGSLGRFGHGQMVPAFEAAAFKLEVGEISDIVETPFGFHIIQRTE